MADLYLIVKDIDIASYSDDSMSVRVEGNIENLIASIEEASNAFIWVVQKQSLNKQSWQVPCLG